MSLLLILFTCFITNICNKMENKQYHSVGKLKKCKIDTANRHIHDGRFGAVKSDSTHHFFGNACTKSGSLRFFPSFSVVDRFCLMSFDFPFGR